MAKGISRHTLVKLDSLACERFQMWRKVYRDTRSLSYIRSHVNDFKMRRKVYRDTRSLSYIRSHMKDFKMRRKVYACIPMRGCFPSKGRKCRIFTSYDRERKHSSAKRSCRRIGLRRRHLHLSRDAVSFFFFFNNVQLHSLKHNSQRLNRRNRGLVLGTSWSRLLILIKVCGG